MAFDEKAIRDLYRRLMDGWNAGDAAAMTADFAEKANIVGYDGTQQDGREAIRKHLADVFGSHEVAAFVTIVREVREILPGTALLRANAGMVPPGKSKVNPDRNAVQTLIVAQHDGRWKVELFQNTPAAWDGRPDDVKSLTAELQAAVEKRS